ncbi:MAG: thioredoxin [Rhodospirillales bacterium]
MEVMIGEGQNAGEGAAVIKDASTASFAEDVIQASMQRPVIVDFWAPWCGPCKQLTPALERAVTQARGAVELVKVNIDENQALAQQLRIQSIPTIYAFFQGRPVDGFQGAVPDSELKTFIDRLIEMGGGEGDNPLQAALEEAEEALTKGDNATAAAIFSQVLQHEPDNLAAIAGLLKAMIAEGQAKEAQAQFDQLPDEIREKPELAAVKAQLALLAESSEAAGQLADLMEAIAKDPDDHQARFDLAQALYGSGKREAAAAELLEIVKRDRAWNEEAARMQLLKYFEAWGHADPLTLDSRRKLSSLLFS